ncbi:MAG TPA: hypothetical protein VFZ11_09760 [Gemmatimonadaceae bacterium]
MSRVRAADRVRDAVAALCLVGGAALYLYAGARIRALASGELSPPPGSSHVAELDRRMAPLTAMSRTGLALVLLGVGVGVWSFVRHRSSTTPPQ